MKDWSVKVPALIGLLHRPLDLGTVELVEAAMRGARVRANWIFPLDNAFRSLKPHGSAPECVLDLLYLLNESSDEKMQQMDLDDVTMERLTAARSALQEAICDAELAVKKGKKAWNCCPAAPWLGYLRVGVWWPRPGSEDLLMLQGLDARASILMTRLEQEAEKENRACLQEVALNSFGILFCRSPNDKDLDPSLE